MTWGSIISSIASATEAGVAFTKAVAGGVSDGAESLASGIASLGKGVLAVVQAGIRATVDPAYRKAKMDQATALASQAADYGGRLYDDPATRKQAYVQVQAAVGSIKDKYDSERAAAEKAGKLPEFYGRIVGRGGFEVGTLLLPVTKLGALGKAGVVAEGTVDLTKVAKMGEVMKGGKAAEVIVECQRVAAIKAARAAEIKSASTFKTIGVDKASAEKYLSTPAGEHLLSELSAADQGASKTTIWTRALDYFLTTGKELPTSQIVNTSLVKIAPRGAAESGFSPFFTSKAELESAAKSGRNLADYFGLPIKSEAVTYDILEITPKSPTTVYLNTVAPTTELEGAVNRSGGALQYLVPNRSNWSTAIKIGEISN